MNILKTKKEEVMILTINGGSSSIKFALYKSADLLTKLLYGEMESMGVENTSLSFYDIITEQKDCQVVKCYRPLPAQPALCKRDRSGKTPIATVAYHGSCYHSLYRRGWDLAMGQQ